jgi:hypothetical protein
MVQRGLLVREAGHRLPKRSTPAGRKRVLVLPLTVYRQEGDSGPDNNWGQVSVIRAHRRHSVE